MGLDEDMDIALVLDEREGELVEELKGLKARLLLDPTLSPEDREARAQDASEAAEAISRVVKQLQKLERLRNSDSYGICEVCSQEIPQARMKANPLASKCIRCQEREERVGEVQAPRKKLRQMYF